MTVPILDAGHRREVARVLQAIARDAGAELMAGFRRGVTVELKGEIDLVTAFDRRSEALIRARIAAELPDFALVAEEGGGAPGVDRPTVYADPLDGTTNFAHGHPIFAVSLGLVEPGAGPTVGVVCAPVLRWTYTGVVGVGASRDGEGIAVSACEALGSALVATGFPYDRRTREDNNLREFVAIEGGQVRGVRRLGSAALDLCLVADGTYDGYWEAGLCPWDTAAGVAIVRAAGGAVSGYDGAPFDLREGRLVVSNGRLHPALLSALAAARR
jgi:myo-inositol-1(or 4)-monophosphatase